MNKYFYIDNEGKQKGVFTPEELRAENIKRDTLVWTNEMTDWSPADGVEELKFLFAGSAGDYPPQNPPYANVVKPVEVDVAPSYAPGSETKPSEPMPKVWLIESVLVTILPFVLCGSVLSLLGIVGIVSASRVESQYSAGEYEQAKASSRQAKRWTLITFWITIGWVVILAIIFVLALVLGFYSGFSDIFEGAMYSI